MQNFQELIRAIIVNGTYKQDRTDVGCYSVFGTHLRWKLSDGFPALTTKRVHMPSVIHELLWFLRGDTNIQYLRDNNVKIWDAWALPEDVKVTRPITVDEVVSIYSAKHKCSPESVISTMRSELQNAQAMAKTEDITLGQAYARIHDLDEVVVGVRGRSGDCGKMYGSNWTNYNGVNQIQWAINQLKERPNSRRIYVTAWNPNVLPDESVSPQENVLNGKGCLPACHHGFQLMAESIADPECYDNVDAPLHRLHLKFDMRSTDAFLGLPFNIASYALLQHMIANEVGMDVGDLIYTGGDTHLYSNQREACHELLARVPRALPRLLLKKPVGTSVFDYTIDDFELVDYDPHPAIKVAIAV